jgi:hypothetical protein
MIETVDQLRMKSDSNTQMLRTHFKNLAKLTTFLATMHFFWCSPLSSSLSTDLHEWLSVCLYALQKYIHDSSTQSIFIELLFIIDFIAQYAYTLMG